MYTPELAQRICERLAAGESLRAICRDDDMPSDSTVHGWVLDDRDGFAEHYARARRIGYQRLADELVELADTPKHGSKTKINADGVEVTEGDMIEHRRLQIDTRKWMLAKMLPKVYGDKVTAEHTGPNGGPITIAAAAMTDEQLAKIAAGDKA